MVGTLDINAAAVLTNEDWELKSTAEDKAYQNHTALNSQHPLFSYMDKTLDISTLTLI